MPRTAKHRARYRIKPAPRHNAEHALHHARGNQAEHRIDNENDKPAPVQLAVLVAEDTRRQRRFHAPGDVAQPPVCIAKQHHLAENGNEGQQSQQEHLAKPTFRLLDVVPCSFEVTLLHDRHPFPFPDFAAHDFPLPMRCANALATNSRTPAASNNTRANTRAAQP